MFSNPSVRLILRAVVAGVTTFATLLQGSNTWDSSLIRAGIVSAVLASLEVLTPLNSQVGPSKTALPVVPPPV